MEEMMESRVWQRVRGGGPDVTERLRQCLTNQGRLRDEYRQLSRRGGKFRLLLENKERQISCLRGLLRIRTGQGAAQPRSGEVRGDLTACFELEQKFLTELTELSKDPDLGPVCEILAQGQKKQLRLLLELFGTL